MNKNTHGILIFWELKPNHEDQLSFAGICISTSHYGTAINIYISCTQEHNNHNQ